MDAATDRRNRIEVRVLASWKRDRQLVDGRPKRTPKAPAVVATPAVPDAVTPVDVPVDPLRRAS